MRKSVVTGVLSVVLVAATASGSAFTSPAKQANAGDSISQGFGANALPWDHPDLSFVQGTDSRIGSVFVRYANRVGSYSEEPESVSGAEMVGGDDSFPAQASRICGQSQRANRVTVLLGANDVCNRPRSGNSDATANMYSLETWNSYVEAGLEQLAACLPADAIVEVLSIPRLDSLYDAGRAKSLWCPWGIWPTAGVCRIVTAETNAGRRAQIGARIDRYNDATSAQVAAFAGNGNGKNPRGVHFSTDWVGSIASGHPNTSIGTYRFGPDDINGTDCFHPNIQGQAKLACLAWGKEPDVASDVSHCF